MNLDRVRLLKAGKDGGGPVVYWMSRDQRAQDNWALFYAQQQALLQKRPLIVVFCLVPNFLGATWRQYDFLLQGLEELNRSLAKRGISFFLLEGDPGEEISGFANRIKAALVVTDFDPLRIKQRWKRAVGKNIRSPFYEVDTHNIVPCWIASAKREFGAYTLRPKIHRVLSAYLEKCPALKVQRERFDRSSNIIDPDKILAGLDADRAVPPVSWIVPGERAAHKALQAFLKERLAGYSERRNDPVQDGQSGLSPYFHFGQLSPQRAALEVSQSAVPLKDKEAFLEELIVRRELADNFCFYHPHYDTVKCAPDWVQKTLTVHAKDQRDYSYTLTQLEAGKTHDDLWNAAQRQMVVSGKMHGYLRMYWAKKILEWTPTIDRAWKTAVYLNDKYELDGRDPNGYAGIAWALGGVHDRAWGERKVFGKIRYMNYNGCRSKFDISKYVEMVSSIKERSG